MFLSDLRTKASTTEGGLQSDSNPGSPTAPDSPSWISRAQSTPGALVQHTQSPPAPASVERSRSDSGERWERTEHRRSQHEDAIKAFVCRARKQQATELSLKRELELKKTWADVQSRLSKELGDLWVKMSDVSSLAEAVSAHIEAIIKANALHAEAWLSAAQHLQASTAESPCLQEALTAYVTATQKLAHSHSATSLPDVLAKLRVRADELAKEEGMCLTEMEASMVEVEAQVKGASAAYDDMETVNKQMEAEYQASSPDTVRACLWSARHKHSALLSAAHHAMEGLAGAVQGRRAELERLNNKRVHAVQTALYSAAVAVNKTPRDLTRTADQMLNKLRAIWVDEVEHSAAHEDAREKDQVHEVLVRAPGRQDWFHLGAIMAPSPAIAAQKMRQNRDEMVKEAQAKYPWGDEGKGGGGGEAAPLEFATRVHEEPGEAMHLCYLDHGSEGPLRAMDSHAHEEARGRALSGASEASTSSVDNDYPFFEDKEELLALRKGCMDWSQSEAGQVWKSAHVVLSLDQYLFVFDRRMARSDGALGLEDPLFIVDLTAPGSTVNTSPDDTTIIKIQLGKAAQAGLAGWIQAIRPSNWLPGSQQPKVLLLRLPNPEDCDSWLQDILAPPVIEQ